MLVIKDVWTKGELVTILFQGFFFHFRGMTINIIVGVELSVKQIKTIYFRENDSEIRMFFFSSAGTFGSFDPFLITNCSGK